MRRTNSYFISSDYNRHGFVTRGQSDASVQRQYPSANRIVRLSNSPIERNNQLSAIYRANEQYARQEQARRHSGR